MISRGLKPTPHQNPLITLGQFRVNPLLIRVLTCDTGKPLIVIIPESKVPDPSTAERGLRLFTVHVRRGNADVKDEMWVCAFLLLIAQVLRRYDNRTI